MTPPLERLITEFRRKHLCYAQQRYAHGSCVKASHTFHNILVDCGFESHTWDIVLDNNHDQQLCPQWYPDIPDEAHTVVYVEGTIIDWTARQYNRKAPFPLVFKPTREPSQPQV